MSTPVQVTGAWLMHHDQKLSAVKSTEFESITTAGRAARLLSYISTEDDWSVPFARVQTLAQANGIRRHEVAGLLSELEKVGVIDQSTGAVAVLGVSQNKLFNYAATVFEEQSPTGLERAALELSELASQSPVEEADSAARLADEYKLSKAETRDLTVLSKQIGFVDHETLQDKTLLFNGSLFKRDDARKSQIILDGLTANERQNLLEAMTALARLAVCRKRRSPQSLGRRFGANCTRSATIK